MSPLTSELAQLRQQRDALRREIDADSNAYDAAKSELDGQASSLQSAADAAAAGMRSAFGAASAAAAAKEGAAAKAAAAQGHAAQAIAEGLNAQKKGLRGQLDGQLSSLKSKRAQLKQLNERIRELEAAKKSSASTKPAKKKLSNRSVQANQKRAEKLAAQPQPVEIQGRIRAVDKVFVDGFEDAKDIDERMVREVLADISERIVENIRTVRYVDRASRTVGKTSAKISSTIKADITIFYTATYGKKDREKEYRETVYHEAGHVLFDWLVSNERRFKWGDMFNKAFFAGQQLVSDYAQESLREDFAESFMFYRMYRDELYKEHRERYDFINEVYKEIEE